jgi:hypothetical protein
MAIEAQKYDPYFVAYYLVEIFSKTEYEGIQFVNAHYIERYKNTSILIECSISIGSLLLLNY